MNAIARPIFDDNNITSKISVNFVVPEISIILLVFLLLISAFGIIYVKDLTRRSFAIYSGERVKLAELQAKSNRILLEQSYLGAEERIQVIAGSDLKMQFPPANEIVMISI